MELSVTLRSISFFLTPGTSIFTRSWFPSSITSHDVSGNFGICGTENEGILNDGDAKLFSMSFLKFSIDFSISSQLGPQYGFNPRV